MTFYPVIPPVALVLTAAVLAMIRMIALYRLLVRTGPGRYLRVVARWSVLTLAVMLLLVAASRPGFDSGQDGAAVDLHPSANADPNLNVFFVVDRSANSRVEDFGDRQTRMSGIRRDIGALIDEYPRARFGLISFAGKAAVDWPLSDDAWSLRSMIKGLSPYTMVAPDAVYQANAFVASVALRNKVAETQNIFPGSKTLVFYFGEGAGGSQVPQGKFDIDRGTIAGGAVLGYGTQAGGPIPQGWVDGSKVYQSDPSGGGALNSTIDESRLKDVAAQLDVPYFHRQSGQPISGVVPAVDPNAAIRHDKDSLTMQLIERRELYWLFALLGAVLLLVEIVLTIREFRRSRMSRRDVSR